LFWIEEIETERSLQQARIESCATAWTQREATRGKDSCEEESRGGGQV